MTEWHARYRGPGVLIYWHVERKSTCIYSQLKRCSSSEVAAMITGLLRHCSEMQVDRNYVDTHGQSEIGFTFCSLLGFQLLPRLKNIHAQKLYRPETGQTDAYPNLQQILTRPIKWDLIRQQYDEMIKFATALRLGTAETEEILRRFTRNGVQHPTYKGLLELGKVQRTIFLSAISNLRLSGARFRKDSTSWKTGTRPPTLFTMVVMGNSQRTGQKIKNWRCLHFTYSKSH